MAEWRSTWLDAGITRAKRQEKVCGFFHLCRDLGWIEMTPTAGMGTIKVEETATGYFPPEEYARFFRAIDAWNDGRWPERERIRLKVLTELMRWSGLAIGVPLGKGYAPSLLFLVRQRKQKVGGRRLAEGVSPCF